MGRRVEHATAGLGAFPVGIRTHNHPRMALIGQIRKVPLHEHEHAIAKADQKQQVRKQPKAPGNEFGKFEAV